MLVRRSSKNGIFLEPIYCVRDESYSTLLKHQLLLPILLQIESPMSWSLAHCACMQLYAQLGAHFVFYDETVCRYIGLKGYRGIAHRHMANKKKTKGRSECIL